MTQKKLWEINRYPISTCKCEQTSLIFKNKIYTLKFNKLSSLISNQQLT